MTETLPLWAANIAVFDTETTGVDTNTARIVSATVALLCESGEVLERYDWLIDPGVVIPDTAVRVHGITTEIARASGIEASVGVKQIAGRIAEMFDRGFPLVAYNAPYDLSLLRAELHRYGHEGGESAATPLSFTPVVDPLILDKQLDRFRKGKRTLEAVTAHYGVELGSAHDAGDDAIASGRVLQRIAAKYGSKLPAELEELHAAQITWAREQAESFQEYMRRVRDPQFVADGGWPER